MRARIVSSVTDEVGLKNPHEGRGHPLASRVNRRELSCQGKFVLPVSGPGGATGIFCHAQIIEDEAHAER